MCVGQDSRIAVLVGATAKARRVAATPETVKKLVIRGAEVAVEPGAALRSNMMLLCGARKMSESIVTVMARGDLIFNRKSRRQSRNGEFAAYL